MVGTFLALHEKMSITNRRGDELVSAPPDAGGHLGSVTTPTDLQSIDRDARVEPNRGLPQAPALHRRVGSMRGLSTESRSEVGQRLESPYAYLIGIGGTALAIVLAIALATLVFG